MLTKLRARLTLAARVDLGVCPILHVSLFDVCKPERGVRYELIQRRSKMDIDG